MRRERERIRNVRRAIRTLARTLTAALPLIGALTAQAGCSSAPIAPTYSQDELKANCERHRGVWHPDDLMGGYCEYRTA
jgi:hypothetical protein